MIQSNSAKQAKAYFSDALVKSDYYISDQELQGRFEGRLAARLGIAGPATRDHFFALIENRHPLTGDTLTPRMKDNRITGYDINFHCPKSVSVIHALTSDDHILKAFESSVQDTMREIEKQAMARIRQKGVYDDRVTGELAWAAFTHQTARPVAASLPDPHLHAHCFVFNATFDETEQRFKAAKFREIKRQMPYFQKQFYKRLADRLSDLGYRIRPTDNSFEIEGVPVPIIKHFSKRTDEIGKAAKEKGITDAKALDALGAKTRSRKQKGFSMDELRHEWRQQLKELSGQINDTISDTINDQPIRHKKEKQPSLTLDTCINHALSHCFERASVVGINDILKAAYRFSLGQSHIPIEQVNEAIHNDDRLLRFNRGSVVLCTTREALAEEKHMVDLAKKGIGAMAPLYHAAPEFLELKGQQADAVAHVLTTSNRVSIVMGAAGTGKTTLMREAAHWMEQAGKTVIAIAPTAQAARGVLRQDGFSDAETVAKLLSDNSLQSKLENQVLWVDEAGLLGTKDMTALLALVQKKNARLILGGDTRQHSSVVRGDALRIINTVGGIRAAEVTMIRRQKTEHYRELVNDLSKGQVESAFAKLQSLGSIKSVDPLSPADRLVDDYMDAVKRRKSVLVISPTHHQGRVVTDRLRDRLKKAKKIGRRELEVSRLENRNLTEAEKSDWRNYEPGHVIQFNQNMKKIKRASRWRVDRIEGANVILTDDQQKQVILPRSRSADFDVFESQRIGLSKGDMVRITRNATDKKEKRLNNGMLLQVARVSKKDGIVLHNPQSKARYRLDAEFGHIDHAYCITSHASQGKTVDEVFVMQPAATFGATNLKQFYVSVSRGREAVHLYTDDKEALMEQASQLGNRLSALELVSQKVDHEKAVEDRIRSEQIKETGTKQQKQINPSHKQKDIDYEPGF